MKSPLLGLVQGDSVWYQIFGPLHPLFGLTVGTLLLLLTPTAKAENHWRTYPVKAFGAVGDGLHDDTDAIQEAIDEAGETGGTVLLTPGTYLSGPLYLKSNVVFDVGENATLEATSNHTAFGEPQNANTSSTGPGLLNASGQCNIAITGGGTIDGNGASWWALPVTLRPKMVYFSHCTHVVITNVTLQNSPSYHFVPLFCEDVVADHINIQAPSTSPNTDGIDPICSHDMVISNCNISVADDDISLKTDGVVDPDATPDPTADCSRVLISGCSLGYGHGLSIGSVTTGGIHDVLVENCTFQNTQNGLRIKSGRDRGGKVQNILYRNITMQNVSPAITFTSFYTGPVLTAPLLSPPPRHSTTTLL